MLHGGGQTRHAWARTAKRLARHGRRVLTADLRGHGDSDWDPSGRYRMGGFVDDVLCLLTDVSGPPPILVGASLGGIAALVAAGENAGLVSALVLVDVVVENDQAGVRRIRDFMSAHLDGFDSLEDVAKVVAAYNPHRQRPPSTLGLRKNLRRGADGRWFWHWDPAFIRTGEHPQNARRVARTRHAAAALRVPVLLVRGGQSDVVTDAGVEDLLSLVRDAKLVDVGRAGHMVAGDDNDVFDSALEVFLDSV
jgi:pimeloyl-ACP methyl ester carboxylesterase